MSNNLPLKTVSKKAIQTAAEQVSKFYFAKNKKNYKVVTPKCLIVDKNKIIIKQTG